MVVKIASFGATRRLPTHADPVFHRSLSRPRNRPNVSPSFVLPVTTMLSFVLVVVAAQRRQRCVLTSHCMRPSLELLQSSVEQGRVTITKRLNVYPPHSW